MDKGPQLVDLEFIKDGLSKWGQTNQAKALFKRGTGSFLSTGPLSSGLEEGSSRAWTFYPAGGFLGQRALVLQL